jgi:hypothetical protein
MDARIDKTGTEVQTLIMGKSRFPTKQEAKAWAVKKGFKSDKIRETGEAWRLKQRAPEDFAQESFQMSNVSTAVKSVTGNLK